MIALATATATFNVAVAQPVQQTVNDWQDAFRQLEDEDWPSPNRERRATGAPGPDYWQQQVDYDIDIRLDEEAVADARPDAPAAHSRTGSRRRRCGVGR